MIPSEGILDAVNPVPAPAMVTGLESVFKISMSSYGFSGINTSSAMPPE